MLPKAASMESFDDDRLNAMHQGNTTPHIIVGCPSCSTKFAVESSVVASVEDPRFHCSRCDEVFSLNDVESVMHQELTGSETERVTQEDHTETSSLHSHQKTPPAQTVSSLKHTSGQDTPQRSSIPSPVRASDFSIGGAGALSNVEPTLQAEDSKPAWTLGAVSGVSHPPSQPKREPLTTVGNSSRSENFELFAQQSEFGGETQRESIAAPSKSASMPLTMSPSAMSPSAMSPSAMSPSARTPTALPTNTVASNIMPSSNPQRELHVESPEYPQQISRGQSLALLSAPLFIALAGLFVLSYSIRLSPDTLGAAASKVPGLFGGVNHSLPPGSLTVSRASIRVVRLPTKESVPVVSGALMNRSDTTVDGVTLEALGFDSSGELLVSAQAPLRSALSKEKINELQIDSIKRFQKALGAKSATIRPGEEVPFTIALIPDGSRDDQPSLAELDLTQLKYFSARVFSVTELNQR